MKIKRLNNRGDTIVEVLICIAILSLIVAAAYSLTSKNQQTAQQSQERGEALKIANTQIELLRTYAEGTSLEPLRSSKFCVTIAAGVLTTTANSAPTPTAAADNFAAYPALCQQGTDSRYKVSVWGYQISNGIQADNSGGKHVFGIAVRWDSVKGNGREEVKTFYSTYDSSSVASPSNIGGVPPGPGPGTGSLQVTVTRDLDLNCATTGLPGNVPLIPVQIVLSPGGATQVTGLFGIATFTNLAPGSYSYTMTSILPTFGTTMACGSPASFTVNTGLLTSVQIVRR